MSRYTVCASWDDCPHLTKEAKDDLYATIPAFQREARIKGLPQLGAGLVYPVAESVFTIEPHDLFPIPREWPRAYGMDVGNNTSAVWAALNPDTSVWYVYKEYFREAAEPSLHASAIKGHEPWIRGVIDPASNQKNQIDGRRIMDMYRKLGLDLVKADNAVNAGIGEVLDALVGGQLKIVTTCSGLLREMRMYQRDEKGNIKKKDDHRVDALRYLWMSGRDRASVAPTRPVRPPRERDLGPNAWMA